MRGWLINSISLWLTLLLSSAIHAQLSRSRIMMREKEILNEILSPSKYDKRIRPFSGNETDYSTLVKVNMLIRNIEVLDDVKMEWKLQVYLRQRWKDESLKFDDLGGQIKYLTLSQPDQLWVPDLFVKNERNGHFHDIVGPNMYLRIFSDGEVLYSRRLSLTLMCPMNLKLYPMDYQTCPFRLASYAHTADDISLVWEERNPVMVTRNLYQPHFSLTKMSTDYCHSRTRTGTYSCLLAEFGFRRETSYYTLTIYVPCMMFVLVAYLAMWLDRKATAARIAMTIISLAVMSMSVAYLNQSMPPVSYTRAIDVWTGMCITFVFGALCECVLVSFLTPESHEGSPKLLKLGRLVDIVSRIGYPAAFLLFNIIYWPSYTNVDHGDQECGEHLSSCELTGL